MTAVLALLGAFAAAHPMAAVIGFVLLRILCIVYPPAPGLPMDLAAIGLFGPAVGFELAELGIMLGATIAFAVGRGARNRDVGSPPSSHLRLLANRVNRSVEASDRRQQFCWWFVVRLLTNPLFDPLSYAGGMSRTGFGPFFFGTALGNIPSIGLFFVAERYAIAAGVQALIVVTTLFGVAIWYAGSRWLSEFESRPTAG